MSASVHTFVVPDGEMWVESNRTAQARSPQAVQGTRTAQALEHSNFPAFRRGAYQDGASAPTLHPHSPRPYARGF
jgi:hypothetical protein